MRAVVLIILNLSLISMTGCLNSGGGNSTTPGDNSSVSDNNNGSGTVGPTLPTTPPAPPVPPTPTGPQPGDIVANSTGLTGAQYPNLGQPLMGAPNPLVEPNSDGILPIIAITAVPNAYIPQTTGSVQFQAADDVNGSGLKEIQCNVDGAGFSLCSEQLDMSSLSEGIHTVKARAEDWDGNQSGEVSYTFYVDTQAPVVTIPVAPAVATQNTVADFQFQGDDAGSGVASYQCQVDSGAMQVCGNTKNIQGLSDGLHTVSVSATDAVGNTSSVTTYQWTVDNQGPDIQFVTQPASTVYVGIANPIVNFVVTDLLSPNGVTATCKLNGQDVSCTSGQDKAIPATVATTYIFTVNAMDQLGNTSSASVQWLSVNETEDRSTSVTVKGDQPVDILFVVDNSGSMNFERSNLAQRIDGMISQLAGIDWQIAVTSTDSTNNNAVSDGRLVELSGLPGQYILDASMDITTAQTSFGNTVQNIASGSGNEEGIYSSVRVIDRYLAGQAEHTNFLRNGADLSIVVLSDEDETSNGSNNRITPQGFVDYVNTSFAGTKNMVFHSIITRPGDSTCLSGQGANYGNTYDALSRLTGFGTVGGAIIGSVCASDYTAQLANIGQSVKDLRNSIKLSCLPFDANGDGIPEVTISYRVDSSAAYTPYTAQNQIVADRVTFTNILPPGDYKADYKCKIN